MPDKTYFEGTHRCVPPAETLRRIWPTARRLGVTRLADVTGLDRIGIPVVMAVRPASRSLSVSQGKGLTLEAAKVSAMMESLELYHGENIALPTRFASLVELQAEGRPVLDVEPIARPAFDPRRRILWVEGVDLLSDEGLSDEGLSGEGLSGGEGVLVPLEAVQADTVLDELPGAGSFAVTSNGLASGNHLTEATVHALCELVERDAASRWLDLNPASRRGSLLRLDGVDDLLCRRLLACFESAEVEVRTWDLGTELGVQVYMTHIADRPGSVWPCPGIYAGAGCHLDAGVALLRSLTEAAQSRLTAVSGARDDIFEAKRRRDDEGCGFKSAAEPVQNFVPCRAGATLDEDLGELLGRLERAGHRQVVRVDLSRPELGVPVVRLVVPTLRFDERLL